MEITNKFGRYTRGAWFDVVAILAGSLVLTFAFRLLGWENPMWAIIAFVLVYEPSACEVMDVALTRLYWTLWGCAGAVVILAVGGGRHWVLPLALGLGALAGVFLAPSLLARRMLLVTVAVVVGSTLMSSSSGLFVAVSRGLEVAVGSLVAAGISWISTRWVRRGNGRRRRRFVWDV